MRDPITKERGVALIAALLFAITIMGLVSAVISAGLATRSQSRYVIARQGAQQAAESGVHLVLARLGGPNGAALLAAGEVAGTIRGTGERAPRYTVQLDEGGADGLDNDLDGFTDEPDESDMVEVASVGTFDGVTRTVRVTLLARYRTPALASATYLASSVTELDFEGNAFLISGNDVDLNGDPTGEQVPGIGVNGPTNIVESQIAGQQDDNVIGLGGEPSVATVPELDLDELVEEGARSANVVMASESGTYTPGEGELGTLEAPTVAYAPSSIRISGGGSGAGIMIVNGDLYIAGSFEWHGLIIVRGQLEFVGGGAAKRVVGGLIVQDELEMDNDGSDFNVTGTVDIVFSQATLVRISQSFRSFTILNWREGPNPDYEAQP